MLEPLRSNVSRRQAGTQKLVPAPTRGWNARDDITDMNRADAIVLDNFVPSESSIRLRDGYSQHASTIGAAVQALLAYEGPSGTRKLFAASGSALFDVTAAGAPASSITGLTSGQWQSVQFGTAGGSFLVIANGFDAVRAFDGAAWSTPAITGVTAANLVNVASHMSRLWFVERNTLKVWYLPASSIAGAAVAIDFGPLSKLGGQLVAMASWTRDGGAGMDDLAAFITSRGEVHIFSGTDPASSTTWERVGTFRMAEPIGYRCVVKLGADVGILTTQGLLSLAGVLDKALSGQNKAAATDQISSAYDAAYRRAPTAAGWQVLELPRQRLLVINVPIQAGVSAEQYVMNSITGGWCRFTGFAAGAWALLGTEAYWGGADGRVFRYGGTTDNGAAIDGVSVGAFDVLGHAGNKHLRRLKPTIRAQDGFRPAVGVRLDYDEAEHISQQVQTGDAVGSYWNEATWDLADWGAGQSINSWWQDAGGQGYAVSVVMRASSTEALSYHGSKILYEQGAGL